MAEISPYIPSILLAYSAFLLGTASPGPNILAVIGTAMSIGRGPGMALALGVAHGERPNGAARLLCRRLNSNQDCRRVIPALARLQSLPVGDQSARSNPNDARANGS